MKWTQSTSQDFTDDLRGWPKGKRRTWNKTTEKRVKEIHKKLTDNRYSFFAGASAIVKEWTEKYSSISPPPLRTIGRILSDLGLSEKRKKGRNKGASRYLCYPEHTIYTRLKGRILEADFIGKKHITGRTEPLNFIAYSFKKESKLRYFKRVSGQTADNFIKQSKHFFRKFEKPDFVKVDNCLATIGSASGKRNLSQTMKFLLKNQVIPIFAVPRKPFSQASIEGNNSVFSRKFWNQIQFKNIKEVDTKLEWFNKDSQKYTGYGRPKKKSGKKKKFVPKIYFIRQVQEDKSKKRMNGYIGILNELIYLPKDYINYFVLAKWNLREGRLYIYFEKEQRSKLIKELSFRINLKSKKGCTDFI